jgi:hypothetical protein
MSLIHNERTKLTATYLNGMAIAIFAVGGLAPAFSSLYAETARGRTSTLVALGLICFLGSVALHLIARRLLKGLKP